ncbi:MAG: hypothetical protein MRJ96_02040 [Nitrospirales bacterium]|nr:hypothetical protein [Nitrospirales bacterium]
MRYRRVPGAFPLSGAILPVSLVLAKKNTNCFVAEVAEKVLGDLITGESQ